MIKKEIENIREAMGTLPSKKPKKNYSYKDDISSIKVRLTEYSNNPYKIITRGVGATWGDNEQGSMYKWEKLTPKNRYLISLASLTGNTLPQAQEGVQFLFEVNGLSRSDFDQHARARIGAYFCSIGTRDNNKLDADFLFYDDIIQRMKVDEKYKNKVLKWIELTKDLYEDTISHSDSSWQTGRAFLPQSINHSYVFGMNLLALRGQMARRLMACEQEGIVTLHWLIRAEVEKKFPLIASFFKPACDKAKKCIYMEGPEGLTKYFSNLFDTCGRWEIQKKENSVYKEFNKSCTNYKRLKELNIPVIDKEEFINYDNNSYESLSILDKNLFEED